ncbi:MAG: HupF/HypC family [Solirubrobacteraceae bacterium]|jgi:hydrogenase maturation factor|nr:HupF/HypC family [Solirubrobacteraceae bacterium]
MIDAADATACRVGDAHCITCSDEGIAMRVIELRGANVLCRDELTAEHVVAADLVWPVAPGDALLVHAGVAIRRLEEAAR